jgi:hypothetical protein
MTYILPGIFPAGQTSSVPSQETRFQHLPDELKFKVAKYLPIHDRGRLRATHRSQVESDWRFNKDAARERQQRLQAKRETPGTWFKDPSDYPMPSVPQSNITQADWQEFVQLFQQPVDIQGNAMIGEFAGGAKRSKRRTKSRQRSKKSKKKSTGKSRKSKRSRKH